MNRTNEWTLLWQRELAWSHRDFGFGNTGTGRRVLDFYLKKCSGYLKECFRKMSESGAEASTFQPQKRKQVVHGLEDQKKVSDCFEILVSYFSRRVKLHRFAKCKSA